jgi:hypothetical protein
VVLVAESAKEWIRFIEQIANCERIASWHRLGIFSQLVAGA